MWGFTRYVFFFLHFFHSVFLKTLFSTNNNFNVPNHANIMAFMHTSDQSGIWAMPCEAAAE